jgi:hypothetical protein
MAERVMIRLFATGAVVAAVLAASAGAKAEQVVSAESENSLYDFCTAPMTDVYRSSVCLGYLEGFSDAMATGPVSGFTACLPRGVTPRQEQDVSRRIPTHDISQRPG